MSAAVIVENAVLSFLRLAPRSRSQAPRCQSRRADEREQEEGRRRALIDEEQTTVRGGETHPSESRQTTRPGLAPAAPASNDRGETDGRRRREDDRSGNPARCCARPRRRENGGENARATARAARRILSQNDGFDQEDETQPHTGRVQHVPKALGSCPKGRRSIVRARIASGMPKRKTGWSSATGRHPTRETKNDQTPQKTTAKLATTDPSAPTRSRRVLPYARASTAAAPGNPACARRSAPPIHW